MSLSINLFREKSMHEKIIRNLELRGQNPELFIDIIKCEKE